MKRIICLIMVLIFSLSFISCDELLERMGFGADKSTDSTTTTKDPVGDPPTDKKEIYEYKGDPITSLLFVTDENTDGGKVAYIIDFEENKVYRKDGITSETIEKDDGFSLIHSFTEDEEKLFVDTCYTQGLFHIEHEHTAQPSDSGVYEWSLTLDFQNGESVLYMGKNVTPKEFNACSREFYYLCGERVLGWLSPMFDVPPNVELGMGCTQDVPAGKEPNMEPNHIMLADYSWDGGRLSSDNDDIFAINESIGVSDHPYCVSCNVQFFASGNVMDERYPAFERFVFKCYDYNEELTNETILCESGWNGKWYGFYCELEYNKIYVYEMYYSNEDYVRYTFNTKVPD